MNKETLISYGLSEEQADKVIADLSGAYVPKSRFDEVNTEKNQLKDTVAERDKQLGDLQKSASGNEALQAEIATLTKANKEQSEANAKAMDTLKKETAIKLGLAGKAHDPSDILSLIDLEKVELDDTGALKTELDTLTKGIRESKPYLFKEEPKPAEPKLEGTVKLETSNPASTLSAEEQQVNQIFGIK